jgi:hypothetical protein
MKKYPCPCCGFKTLEEKPSGTDIICKVCFWQDDYVQAKDVDYWGGSNELSLRDSQKNFLSFGAIEERFIKNVRKPTIEEAKDINWKPLALK